MRDILIIILTVILSITIGLIIIKNLKDTLKQNTAVESNYKINDIDNIDNKVDNVDNFAQDKNLNNSGINLENIILKDDKVDNKKTSTNNINPKSNTWIIYNYNIDKVDNNVDNMNITDNFAQDKYIIENDNDLEKFLKEVVK